MATQSIAAPRAAITLSPGHVARIYFKEAKYEFLKCLRIPMYSVSTTLFPVMFYILFGLLMGKQRIGDVSTTAYLLATYGTFGVMGASLWGTAGSLAAERGLGWLQVKRASPMPPFAYFTAKIALSVIFSSIVLFLLGILGFTFGGVHLSALDSAKLFGTLVLGALPFCAMGLAIGYFAGPNSAPAAINLFYLPLSFASGLWVPYIFLPHFIQKVALILPSYHLAQLGLDIVGAGQHDSTWGHWKVLIAFTMICLGVAYLGFRRDEGKSYG